MIAHKESLMDTLEYSHLLSSLDRQLERAKRETEAKAKREETEQRIKLIDRWVEGLEKKKAEFEKYQARPAEDIDSILEKLLTERQDLQAYLEGRQGLHELSAPDYQAMKALLAEIEQGVLPDDRELCWWTFEMWAIRWRMAFDTLSEEAHESNNFMKLIYARIREAMKLHPGQWFIRALDREAHEAWTHRLEECKTRFRKREEEIEKEAAEKNAADEAVVDLTEAFLAHQEAPDAETDRKLRHYVRNAAKYPHLRDEVAQIVAPLKEDLLSEFGFLWVQPTKVEEEAPSRKLTNREIVARLLRRMKAKALIGGSHGPYEQMYKGFPEHDASRAREALDLLIRAGVVKSKPSGIGQRVAIKAPMIQRIDSFMNGEPLGIQEVDDWMAQN